MYIASKTQWLSPMWFLLVLGCLVFTPVSQAYDPSCSWPGQEPGVVAATEAQLHISVKWCGISEAPSIDDPTLVCQSPGDFKTVMWRRHERASDSIWIPQCRITLRSGGAIQKSDYISFADLDTSIGNAGDIVVDPIDEMDDTWEECDMMWAAQPKGIIAISANRLIDSTGTSVARGIAYVGSITRPYAAVADADNLCQLNERSLAHEVGHILSLPHVSTAGNLMQTGGTGATLTLTQCNTTRDYLEDNTILDPPALIAQFQASNLVDYVFDVRGDADETAASLDICKVVVMDNTATRGNLHFCIGTDGIPERGDLITYYLLLDTDNNVQTGGRPAGRLQVDTIAGVEYLAEVTYDPKDRVADVTLLEPGELGNFVPVLLEPGLITAQVRTIDLVICDPFPEFKGEAVLPKFNEIDVIIANRALPLLGLPTDGRVFRQGLRLQAGASAPFTEIIDLAPNTGGVLEFPEIVFPTIETPEGANRGETVPVALGNMPPDANLVVFLGQFKLDPGARTDSRGFAEFEFVVPAESPIGPTLLTVGIDNPNNAITADTIIDVIGQTDGRLAYELELWEGVNLVSVPLDPGVAWRLRDLANHIGPAVSFIVWYDHAARRFISYFTDFPEDSPANKLVAGEEGYIVVMKEAAKVKFVGEGWQNTSPAAPGAPVNEGAVLVLDGLLFHDELGARLNGAQVVARNTRTGAVAKDITGMLSRSGGYTLTFANLNGSTVASIGDAIELSVYDEEGRALMQPVTYQVTVDALRENRLTLDALWVAPIPKETALFSNYPNPFNPETWIPYQLAEGAHVQIEIYDPSGRLVRTLALGQQPAGTYLSRARAAYWDGKNALGEAVTSGIYFYILKAGSFSQTRKMVIVK